MSEGKSLNKYGYMRLKYLKENRPSLYSSMILSGELNTHLKEIGELAAERVDVLTEKLTKVASISDKALDAEGWVATMNALKSQAEEIVLNELIYA